MKQKNLLLKFLLIGFLCGIRVEKIETIEEPAPIWAEVVRRPRPQVQAIKLKGSVGKIIGGGEGRVWGAIVGLKKKLKDLPVDIIARIIEELIKGEEYTDAQKLNIVFELISSPEYEGTSAQQYLVNLIYSKFRLEEIKSAAKALGYTKIILLFMPKDPEVIEELLHLIREGNVEDVQDFIEGPALPDINALLPNLPLNVAAAVKKPEIIELLIKKGANPNLKERKKGTFPLLAAALVRSLWDVRTDKMIHFDAEQIIQTVQALLVGKADPNLRDGDGKAVLMKVVNESGDEAPQIVELLLKWKADPNIQDIFGYTALTSALQWYYNTKKEKQYALSEKYYAIIDLLLKHEKIDTNKVISEHLGGSSALTFAVENADAEMVKRLLDKGADPEIGSSRTFAENNLITAVKIARAKEDPDYLGIIEALLKADAKVDAQDYSGRTPLMFAAGFGNLKIIEILLNYGANVMITDENGKTALGYAGRLMKKGTEIAETTPGGEPLPDEEIEKVRNAVAKVIRHRIEPLMKKQEKEEKEKEEKG
jgi:ankyrin repeat protein